MSVGAIFLALGEDGYEYCHPINPSDFETINKKINGTSQAEDWDPISVEIVQEDHQLRLHQSDSPWLGDHALIFRSKAILTMGQMLGDAGELLPLVCRNARLCIFNPLNALPALDESASSVVRFEDGRIMMVQKYAFVKSMLNNVNAFKLTNLRVSPTFVSKRMVDSWHASGLKGLRFRQVA